MSLDVSPIGIIAGATSTALSIYQTIQAGIEKKRIREEYDAYNPMDIKNPYAGMDKAPTDAYQLRSDANARALATGASVSQMAGRGLSTMPQLTNQYSQQEAALGADLAQYAYNVDVRMGQGEQMRQGMEFERENRYLEGLAGGYGQASTNMNDAMVGIGSGLVSLGSEMDAAGVFDGSKGNTPYTGGGGINPTQPTNMNRNSSFWD